MTAPTAAERAATIDRWQAAMMWVARMQSRVSYYETNSGRGPLGIQPVVEAEARTAAGDSAPEVAA